MGKRKSRTCLLVLLQVGLFSIPSLAESGQKFGLDDVQEWARTGAPDAVMISSQEGFAESNLKLFKFSLYPRLDGEVTQTYSSEGLSGSPIQRPGDLANLRSGWNSSVYLNLSANIYRGGSDLASYRAQEADLAASRLRDPILRSDLALTAAMQYLNLGFTRRSLARKSAALLLLGRQEGAIRRTFKSIGMSRSEFDAYVDMLGSLRSETETLKSQAAEHLETLRATLGKPGLNADDLSFSECEISTVRSFEELVGQKSIPESSDDPQLMAEQGLRQAAISYGLRADLGSLYPLVDLRSRIDQSGRFNTTIWLTAPLSDYPLFSSELRKRAAEQTRVQEASFLRERSERIARKRRLFEDLMESSRYLKEITTIKVQLEADWRLAQKRFSSGVDTIPEYIRVYSRREQLESSWDEILSRYLMSIYSLQSIGQQVKFDPSASR